MEKQTSKNLNPLIINIANHLLKVISVELESDSSCIIIKAIPFGNSKVSELLDKVGQVYDKQNTTQTEEINTVSNSNGLSSELNEAITKFIYTRKLQFPNFSSVINAKVTDAANEIIKLLKKGYKSNIIIECLHIALYDSFWDRNLMVLTSLNKKCSDGLTKFEHLLNILERKNKMNNKDTNKSKDQGFAYEEL